MAKQKFEIGEKEKHLIEVETSLFWKTIKVKLDGRTVVNDFHPSPVPKKFPFEVGDTELHQVDVSAGGFSSIELLVDGKPAKKL